MQLPAAKTTGLTRTTVHRQYNRTQPAVGVLLLGNLVPIVFNVPQIGAKHKPSILMLGKRRHAHSPYEDLGVRCESCTTVMAFNIRHFVKCYLPTVIGKTGELHTPYMYNQCKKCNVTAVDKCGHLLQYVSTRKYRVNKFIFKANKVLQNKTGRGEIFTDREGLC